MGTIKISPSILSADFSRLGMEIENLEKALKSPKKPFTVIIGGSKKNMNYQNLSKLINNKVKLIIFLYLLVFALLVFLFLLFVLLSLSIQPLPLQ